MDIFLPILSAILQAGSFTLDKIILSLKRITYQTYVGISFPLIFFINLVIFFIFRPPFTAHLFTGFLPWLFLALGIITIVTNLLYYRALDEDRLGEIQTIELLRSLPVIIFSSILFTNERNYSIFIPAIIASLIVVWSHWEKHHINIRRKTLTYLVWSLIAAPITAILVKLLLTSWNPIVLQLLLFGFLACILTPLFYKKNKHVSRKAIGLLLLTNILSCLGWLLYYFSFQRSGIVYTTLIFSLQPLLVYFASILILKEHPNLKKTIAFGIVLISIAIAQILK